MILDTDKESAKYVKNIEGWVSNKGHFYGIDEEQARWDGCTHVTCEDCGEPVDKKRHRTCCETCINKRDDERYFARPEKKWDGEEPLFSYLLDEYFFSEEDMLDHMDWAGVKAKDLKLVICEEEEVLFLEADYWDSSLPDGYEIPDNVQDIIDQLNDAMQNQVEKTWVPSQYRTKYEDKK